MRSVRLEFLDALLSGKPFKLPEWSRFLSKNKENKITYEDSDEEFDVFKYEYVSAKNWQLKIVSEKPFEPQKISLEQYRFYILKNGYIAQVKDIYEDGSFGGVFLDKDLNTWGRCTWEKDGFHKNASYCVDRAYGD